MADYNDIKARIQEVIRPNGTGAITAADHQKLLIEMVDKIDNDFDNVEENIKNAASQDGKYPSFTAGFATNLVGRGEAVDATINFRPSGGASIEDGAARVKELKGNSVVWNNLAKKQSNGNAVGVYATWEDNVVHMSGSISSEGDPNIYSVLKPISVSEGEKYAIIAGGSKQYMVFPYGAMTIGLTSSQAIAVATKSGEALFSLRPLENYIIGATIKEYIKPCVVNLTKMFGAGNEPTTIEEFYNRIPQNVDLYAYNEGEIVSTNAEGIKSVGFNAWDEQWELGYWDTDTGKPTYATNWARSKNYIRILPNTLYYMRFNAGVSATMGNMVFYDIDKKVLSYQPSIREGEFTTPIGACYMTFYAGRGFEESKGNVIHLAHSGYRNGEYQPYMQFIRDIDPRIREAFPNGMRSAGTASDKVYNKNGKGYIEKRIGVVDMGSLDWAKAMGASHSFYVSGFATSYGSKGAQIVSSMYQFGTAYNDSFPNLNASIDTNTNLYARNDSYSDAATFKAAMSGVPLFYELAEPEILEFDEPFNLDYEVWDFGTEQMLSTEPSAPIKASIVYGFNAVDSVRTAQLEIAELKTQIAQMQAIMASMTAQSAALTE